MKILVINCGSSSLKYQLFDMNDEKVIAKGLVERIGISGSTLIHSSKGEKHTITKDLKDHKEAIKIVLDSLIDDKIGVISSMDEINAVGHRVVHGGEKYSSSVIINEEVMKDLEKYVKLAPLHNPPNIIGIEACKELMPTVPMVAVFDTAFHQTMPDYAYVYALPYELYEKNSVRKYGFHGTSHKFVSKAAADFLHKDIKDLKIITCHLGNGSSLTAVQNGESVDTSMGFTPLDGICMGTRSGSIDPAITTYLMKEENMSLEEVEVMLNKKSGVYGVSGVSSDFRDIIAERANGNDRARLALKIFTYKVKQFIGAYAAAMGGVDCIVFTGGVGENSKPTRELICEGLEFLGAKLNKVINNEIMGIEADISLPDSKVKILVIPTNEELMIARETKDITNN